MQAIYFSDACIFPWSENVPVPITLTEYNIQSVFDQSHSGYRTYQESPEYEIYQKYIETQNQYLRVFKMIQNGKIDYFVSEYKKSIGQGAYGSASLAINIVTGDIIVVKDAHEWRGIVDDETLCLKKVGSYIAHTGKTILMKKAHGISYQDILKNNTITDERKIDLHKKVIKKLIELHKIYHIIHNDAKPEHIFIDENDRIELIDFGLSFCKSVAFSLEYLKRSYNKEIGYLNVHAQQDCAGHCGKLFDQYIDSLHDSEYAHEYYYRLLLIILFTMFVLFCMKKIQAPEKDAKDYLLNC